MVYTQHDGQVKLLSCGQDSLVHQRQADKPSQIVASYTLDAPLHDLLCATDGNFVVAQDDMYVKVSNTQRLAYHAAVSVAPPMKMAFLLLARRHMH